MAETPDLISRCHPETPYDDDRPKADRRTDGDWVSEEVDERPNAVDNDLDVDKPKVKVRRLFRMMSGLAPSQSCKTAMGNFQCISGFSPSRSEGVFPPKARLYLESQSFETTFADYESCEAYEQEPEYSPELYEATLSRDCRENDAQQEDISNQLKKKGDPGITSSDLCTRSSANCEEPEHCLKER